ncbi:hypothetical protein M422DRAFT_266466 [Sphaerobolus stellatus SS14]|nr:hypothetical protein M422DRAFT_266466 [Sphaerobolus stellatus SS14]
MAPPWSGLARNVADGGWKDRCYCRAARPLTLAIVLATGTAAECAYLTAGPGRVFGMRKTSGTRWQYNSHKTMSAFLEMIFLLPKYVSLPVLHLHYPPWRSF